MREMDPIPDGSIYLWMYRQGLKHIPYREIAIALHNAGKVIREKDERNYYAGYFNSDLHNGSFDHKVSLGYDAIAKAKANAFQQMRYSDYPMHPYADMDYDIVNRWVPCNAENKPMIKWGKGCLSLDEAMAWMGCEYLAENLYGTKMIVIDIDGDHDDKVDNGVTERFKELSRTTHTIFKPGKFTVTGTPVSYHMTFMVDRVIPTKHFPSARLDIIGNRANSIRYFKNKLYNGLPMRMMDDDIWEYIKDWIAFREAR